MTLNQRIRISESYHWARGALGTIVRNPVVFPDEIKDWADGFSRTLITRKGKKVFYWVRFDSPQFDSDGDGPYGEAAIDGDFIEPLS